MESQWSGQWFAAAFHWSKLLECEPSNPEFLRRRAAANRQLGRLAEARSDLSKAVELQPRDAKTWKERGHVHAELGQWCEAASDFATARDLSATDARMWCMLGYAQLAGDDLAGYRRTCQEMLVRFSDTQDAPSANSVAWLAALTPVIWPTESERSTLIRLAKLARDRHPGDLNHLDTLGAVLYRVGRFSEAAQCLTQVVTKQGDAVSASTCFFLAMTCHQMGRGAEAQQWLDKALARSEKDTAWDLRVIHRVLCQEAQSLLKPAAPPAPAAPPSPPPLPPDAAAPTK